MSISSANAVFILGVPLILPVPQQIQKWAADDMFDTDDIAATETMMSVDGYLSGGVVLAPKPMSISLMADSASLSFFDAWYEGQIAATDAFPAQGVVTLTSLGQTFNLVNGFLTNYKLMPDAKKVLQPRRFRITWERIIPAPVGSAG